MSEKNTMFNCLVRYHQEWHTAKEWGGLSGLTFQRASLALSHLKKEGHVERDTKTLEPRGYQFIYRLKVAT